MPTFLPGGRSRAAPPSQFRGSDSVATAPTALGGELNVKKVVPSVRRLPVVPTLILGLICIAASVVASVAFGSESISFGDAAAVLASRIGINTQHDFVLETIVWQLRLPRALLAVIVGAGLAIAGVGMQTLVRNPLADPYLLGISSGASVGATAVITLGVFSGLGIYALSGGALLGALASAMIVYLVSAAQGGLTPLRLVLSGVVLSAAFSSVSAFMVFASDEPHAADAVMFWTLGGLTTATWSSVLPPLLVVIAAMISMLAVHSWLDALASGPDTAAALGVPVQALRTALFVGLGVLVGVLVAASGGIGFVGLILPHIARIAVGARHRLVVPVAAMGGALFLLWVDVIARTVASPQEMPLGVVTGVIGAPLFLFLMGRRRYAFGGAAG